MIEDMVYLSVLIGFCLLSLAYIAGCEHLKKKGAQEK